MDNFGGINWEAQISVRPDMPQELFHKLKASGCYHLFVGLESGSDRTLKSMAKGYTGEEALIFFKRLKQARLSFGISIIVGYPGETERDFNESLEFVTGSRELIPKIEQLNPFTYYEGTSAPRQADYKRNQVSLKRLKIFLDEIRKHGMRYTNAYIGNLVDRAWK
jgi:threonylcarbamoyladenosine tRNA methylthiotransferase MtaB